MLIRRSIAACAIAMLTLAIVPVQASATTLTATLVDVHHLKAKKGKPGGVANCTNDRPADYTGSWTATGWTVGFTDAHINTATIPSSLGSITSATGGAFDAWTGGGVPAYSVSTDGTVTRQTANRQTDVLFGRTGGSIATTYTWLWSDDKYESDVVFSKGLSWYQASSDGDGCEEGAGSKYDYKNIAVHEYGHVYGLGHAPNSRFESMYAYGYTGETLKRTPTPGEKDGLASLY